jgi:hypothetical protein
MIPDTIRRRWSGTLAPLACRLLVVTLLLAAPVVAHAAGTGMPWEGPIKNLSFAQMEHQVRRALCQPFVELDWELQ